MIGGFGTDIVEIERIVQALARTPALARRILTNTELQHFAEAREPARFLAKRFAAKEACVKALGTGIGRGIGWQQISVDHDEWGKPLLQLEGEAQRLAAERKLTHWHLSYSDERHYVIASVIAESRS